MDKNGWISVKDRLPADFEPVLVVSEERAMTVAYREDNKWLQDYWNKIEPSIEGIVFTHWMPLPEAPESD